MEMEMEMEMQPVPAPSPNLGRWNVLQNFDHQKHYYDDPFPHVIIEDALPEDLYQILLKDFPQQELINPNYKRDHNTWRLSQYEKEFSTLKPSQEWQEFHAYHSSQAFYDQLMKIFEPFIREYYPIIAEELLTTPVKSRQKSNLGKHTIYTDTQFVLNQPSDVTSRTTHVDNPREIYASLYYLRDSQDLSTGGDLVLYHPTQEYHQTDIKKKNSRQLKLTLVEPMKTIPYRGNTYALFLSIRESPHGVTPRVDAQHNRLSINIIAEVDVDLWPLKFSGARAISLIKPKKAKKAQKSQMPEPDVPEMQSVPEREQTIVSNCPETSEPMPDLI